MTLYDDLGIPKNATIDQIKDAYREKAKAHHPDKGGSSEAFRRVSNAYAILSDEEKRKRYDNGESPESLNDPTKGQEQMLNIVLGLFSTIIDGNFDHAHDNVFEIIRETIKHNQDVVIVEKKNCQKMIKNYNNVLTRIKKTEMSTLFTILLEHKIKTCEASITKLDKDMELCTDALTLIKDCQYKTDRPSQMDEDYEFLLASVNRRYGNRTTSSTTAL